MGGSETVGVFSQDCFYKDLTKEQLASVASYNWDHPDAFDWEETFDAIKVLREGERFAFQLMTMRTTDVIPLGVVK